LIFFTINY